MATYNIPAALTAIATDNYDIVSAIQPGTPPNYVESIERLIQFFNERKCGGKTIAVEIDGQERQFILDDAHKKDIDPKDSYCQRALTFAGTACMLIEQHKPEPKDKEEIKAQIKQAAIKEIERVQNSEKFGDPAQANVKKQMGQFTGELSAILGKHLKDPKAKPLGGKKAAKSLITAEPLYVASLGATDHITKLQRDDTTYYQVTSYKDALANTGLRDEYRKILNSDVDQQPIWFQKLPPAKQAVLQDIVANERWDALNFIPATEDKIPGLRNARSAELYAQEVSQTADGPQYSYAKLASAHSSSSKIPNGIKEEYREERQRLASLNAHGYAETYTQNKVHLVNLLSKVSFLEKAVAKIEGWTGIKLPFVGGANNNTTMIEEQQHAFASLKGNTTYTQSNAPVNRWGLFTKEKWAGLFSNKNSTDPTNLLVKEAREQFAQDPHIQAIANELEHTHKHPFQGENATLYKVIYETYLAQKMGYDSDINCKSGKDRTGMLNAGVEALAIYQHQYGELPRYSDLAAGNNETSQQFAKIFAETYFAHARAAGVNSPGSDDLKRSEVPLPKSIKAALKNEYEFTQYKLGDLNKPKPKISEETTKQEKQPLIQAQETAKENNHQEAPTNKRNLTPSAQLYLELNKISNQLINLSEDIKQLETNAQTQSTDLASAKNKISAISKQFDTLVKTDSETKVFAEAITDMKNKITSKLENLDAIANQKNIVKTQQSLNLDTEIEPRASIKY